ELRNVARMPVDAALITARLGKPGDLRRPIADRDQKHPTVSAATQANTRDLAKWHVDHTAQSQPVLVRLTFFHHGRGRSYTCIGEIDAFLTKTTSSTPTSASNLYHLVRQFVGI